MTLTIHEYPQTIASAVMQLHKTTRHLNDIREELQRIEIEIKGQVQTAINEETRKPLYSNDTAREAAVALKLDESAGYRDLRAAERVAELDKALASAELERLRKEYEIALLDYEAERLGRRPAA